MTDHVIYTLNDEMLPKECDILITDVKIDLRIEGCVIASWILVNGLWQPNCLLLENLWELQLEFINTYKEILGL